MPYRRCLGRGMGGWSGAPRLPLRIDDLSRARAVCCCVPRLVGAILCAASPGWRVPRVKSMCGVDGVMLTRRERRALNRVPEVRRLLGLESLTTPGLLQDRAATAARLRYICAELLESPCGEPRDRLKAAELLAKLDGAFAPERHLIETQTRRTPDEMRAIVAREVGAIQAPSPGDSPAPAAHTRDGRPDWAGADQPLPARAVGDAAKPAKKAKGKPGRRS